MQPDHLLCRQPRQAADIRHIRRVRPLIAYRDPKDPLAGPGVLPVGTEKVQNMLFQPAAGKDQRLIVDGQTAESGNGFPDPPDSGGLDPVRQKADLPADPGRKLLGKGHRDRAVAAG